MATMTRLQALPLAYCHEERNWYRGLTALDQNVIPVVNPEGFLTADEFALLDASLAAPRNGSGSRQRESGVAAMTPNVRTRSAIIRPVAARRTPIRGGRRRKSRNLLPQAVSFVFLTARRGSKASFCGEDVSFPYATSPRCSLARASLPGVSTWSLSATTGRESEWVALPVTGDCELIAAEMTDAGESDAPYVAGWISHNGEVIEVLNLDALTPGEEGLPAASSARRYSGGQTVIPPARGPKVLADR